VNKLEAGLPITIRPAIPADRPFISQTLIREFTSTQIWSRRQKFEAMDLPALIAEDRGTPIGLSIYRHDHPELELLCLVATTHHQGTGSLLLEATRQLAQKLGARRLFLGMKIAAFHAGAMDHAREHNPAIPELGHYNIPMRDDIELEYVL
jgi:N-acetylglutamate synthase-like GNAT family acetyltransferase